MAELYDEEGNPVEAITAEEAEAKATEAANAAKVEAETAAKAEIDKKEEELQKLRDKETNFAKLRDKTAGGEEKGKELQERIEKMEKELEEAKGSGSRVFLDSVKDDQIKALAGDDPELEKQIRANYDVLNLPTATKEQIHDRVVRAFKLSADGVSVPTGPTAPAGPGRPMNQKGSGSEPSEELIGFAGRFGVSDEDFKNYGKASTTKS